MAREMEMVVDGGGDVRCIYGEECDLRELGKLQITRGQSRGARQERLLVGEYGAIWRAGVGAVQDPQRK